MLGNNVESRADFEYRRQQTVAANAQGSLASVLGAVYEVPGVLDAYVTENVSSSSGASITGSITGSTLTVASVISGAVAIGQTVVGVSVPQGMLIASGSGTTWGLSQSVASPISTEAMTCAVGGVALAANSIYVAVYGGNENAVAQAIFTKKSPGCNYNGNTTVTVQDTNPLYSVPYPSYSVTFEIPTTTPILFSVTLKNNSQVPSNVDQLVQQAIISTFTGANNGQRARIGSNILASYYYAPIFALGAWAQVVSIQLGVTSANLTSVLMQINQEPTISAANISVTLV